MEVFLSIILIFIIATILSAAGIFVGEFFGKIHKEKHYGETVLFESKAPFSVPIMDAQEDFVRTAFKEVKAFAANNTFKVDKVIIKLEYEADTTDPQEWTSGRSNSHVQIVRKNNQLIAICHLNSCITHG